MNEYDVWCKTCAKGVHFSVPADITAITALACHVCRNLCSTVFPILCTVGCGTVCGQRVLPYGQFPIVQNGLDGEPTTGAVCNACQTAYIARANEKQRIARAEALKRVNNGKADVSDFRLILTGQ